MKTGRPVWNPYLRDAITRKLLKGMSVADAAVTYDIPRTVLWTWLEKERHKCKQSG
jgi:predicted DNA-binding protein (UPF0251 family)